MTMIGRTYLWRPIVVSGDKLTRGPAEPVVVVARWRGKGPRNVLLRRRGGSLVVRPFRGLRRCKHDLRRQPYGPVELDYLVDVVCLQCWQVWRVDACGAFLLIPPFTAADYWTHRSEIEGRP